MSMGGGEQATAGADDVVVADGVAVNMNIQVNGFVAEDEKGQSKDANPAGSLGDGFLTYKRRKQAQAEDKKVSASVASQIEEKVKYFHFNLFLVSMPKLMLFSSSIWFSICF